MTIGDRRRDIGLDHLERRHAVDPHHRRRRVADDAARAAGVRRGDDRGEVADVHLAAEHDARDRSADQRGRDVVEERREHEDDARAARTRPSSRPAAGAAATRARGCPRNGATAARSPSGAAAGSRSAPTRGRDACRSPAIPGPDGNGENRILKSADDGEPDQRDAQRVVVEDRDAGEHDREQEEVDRDRPDRGRLGERRGGERERWHEARDGSEDERTIRRSRAGRVGSGRREGGHGRGVGREAAFPRRRRAAALPFASAGSSRGRGERIWPRL